MSLLACWAGTSPYPDNGNPHPFVHCLTGKLLSDGRAPRLRLLCSTALPFPTAASSFSVCSWSDVLRRAFSLSYCVTIYSLFTLALIILMLCLQMVQMSITISAFWLAISPLSCSHVLMLSWMHLTCFFTLSLSFESHNYQIKTFLHGILECGC